MPLQTAAAEHRYPALARVVAAETLLRQQFAVGDRVLLRRPPSALLAELSAEGVSHRLLPLLSAKVYEVFKVVGRSSYVIADPDSKSTELGFAQPVAQERLVAFDLADLDIPIDLR